jgi:hypothetical protein
MKFELPPDDKAKGCAWHGGCDAQSDKWAFAVAL